MTRPSTTRRRFLAGAGIAAGTTGAGCMLPRSSTRVAAGDALLSFEAVDEGLRERTVSVYDRVEGMVEASIRSPTTVELIDSTEMREMARTGGVTGETTTQQLAHMALGLTDELDPQIPFEFAGAYFPSDERILLVGDDGDDISDQLIAHELTHAIQFQDSDVVTWDRSWEIGFDRFYAKGSVVEGTAQFVEDQYVGGCDGEFSSCMLADSNSINPRGIDSTLLLAFGIYFNGHDFVDAIAERAGWQGVWDAHAHAPAHSGQILKPEWYPDREPESVPAVDVDSGDGASGNGASGDWYRLDDEQLGMQSVFLTLWIENALPDEAIHAMDPDDSDPVFSTLIRYRDGVSDAWRGDRFTAFERTDDRLGWNWRIRFSDTTAAETGYETFTEWGDNRGSAVEDGLWERTDGYEALVLDDADLVVGNAPEIDDFEAIVPVFDD